MKTLLKIVILAVMFNSCKRKKQKILNTNEIDNVKTIELINYLKKEEKNGYLSSKCVAENIKNPKDITTEFVSMMRNKLKIQNINHLNNQIKNFKNFKIHKKLFPEKNIISESFIDSLQRKVTEEKLLLSELLKPDCDGSFFVLSKPFFNENYTLAIVQIGNICGKLCGRGETRVYEYLNGNWTVIDVFDKWVS